MRVGLLPMSLVSLLSVCLNSATATGSDTTTSNATHPLLFTPSSPSLPTYHTSLATLLPILPHLAPPPTHTLLVTLATSAFKPLLYNYLCFLRYRAKWGTTPLTHPYEHLNRTNNRFAYENRKQVYEDFPKILVITSDHELAQELSESGIVVWFLDAIDWESDEAERWAEGTLQDGQTKRRIDKLIQDDLYASVRMMDLLLPPTKKRGDKLEGPKGFRGKMIEWGSLHYQSLMLERTLVMSSLVGAIVDSQKVDSSWRLQQKREWQKKWDSHDWENEPPLVEAPFVGVKGVLLADNDAVWLSTPAPYFDHHYRPQGSHPSILVASDTNPHERANQYGLSFTPCACFIYSRTSDIDAPSTRPEPEDAENYSPSTGAATAWRFTAICHLAMLLQSLEDGHAQAAGMDADGVDDPDAGRISSLRKAIAPSFQGTSLGPAMALAEAEYPPLPVLTHREWSEVLASFDTSALVALLEESGLGGAMNEDVIGDPTAYSRIETDKRTICEDLVIDQFKRGPQCPNSLHRTSLTKAAALRKKGRAAHRPIKTELLPYDMFPPGIRYFSGGMDNGARPCVVHANYALGKTKEELLRKHQLWALLQDESGEYRCDAEVMSRAK